MKIRMKKIILRILTAILSVTLLFSVIFFTSFKENDDFEIAKNLDIYYTVIRELSLHYVDESDVGKLVRTSIEAMLNSLDPYTNYIPESRIEDYRVMTTGQYGGIGVAVIQRNNEVFVVELAEGSPAQLAGIKLGDRILKISGVDISDKNEEDINRLLKGQPNSPVELMLKKAVTNEIKTVMVGRQIIHIDNVPYYGMIDDETGYIKLTGFTEEASSEVKTALLKLKEEHNAKSVVLDLRGNPGGLLIEAVRIVNLFMDKGVEVVSTKGKVEMRNHTFYAEFPATDTQIPLVVLINRGSASAAEIVSGAIQDFDRGVIIGQRSYGKGLVQETRELSYGAQMKLTIAKYYIPSGRCIQALDYSHRNEDGSVGRVPDSLVTAFKTLNGRTVYDGGGVMPDIEIEERTFSNILTALNDNFIFFDFACVFENQHATIAPADEFQFTDADFDKFIEFVVNSDFDYHTEREDKLLELIEAAKAEKYYEGSEDLFNKLSQQMTHNIENDLRKFKDEIKQILSFEIVGRYYFDKGKVEYALSNDKEVKAALEVLKNEAQYKSILGL